MKKFKYILVLAGVLVSAASFGTTYTVTNTNDSGTGSLRQAITDANASSSTPHTINFAITGGTAPYSILPLTALPAIVKQITINGFSQGGNGNYHIYIDGTSTGSNINGIEIGSGGSNSLIQGLVIMKWKGNGINISNASSCSLLSNIIKENTKSGIRLFTATGTIIQSNKIGTNETGLAVALNQEYGIWVYRSDNVLIGGVGYLKNNGQGNLISGNSQGGIQADTSDYLTIKSNYVGVNITGTSALLNQYIGMYINDCNYAKIGLRNEGNLISGNSGGYGIHVYSVIEKTKDNLIQGNICGTDATGISVLGGGGVSLWNSENLIIGGPNEGEGNLISGNEIGIQACQLTDSKIQGNKIGTNITGTIGLGNSRGIVLGCTSHNLLIGGAQPGEGNLISGNNQIGIFFVQSNYGKIIGNKIGTDITGMYAIGNGDGIYLNGIDYIIGGSAPGEGNLISGNTNYGINSTFAFNAVIRGNKIGTNVKGTGIVGNKSGILAGTNFTIGGSLSGEANIIAGSNGINGIYIFSTNKNLISHNSIYGFSKAINLNYGNTGWEGNDAKQAPTITENPELKIVSGSKVFHVKGTSVAGDVIEIFRGSSHPQDAMEYLGTVTAHSSTGAWEFFAPADRGYNYFIATATDVTLSGGIPANNTSELSNRVQGFNDECESCISSFAPAPGKEYIISAWVKEEVSVIPAYYAHSNITLSFLGSTQVIGPFVPSATSAVIDGWQRIEGRFTIPIGASKIHINLNSTWTEDVYFDDIRVHPVDASLVSFVYDPVTQRLTAQLDENNYATFYEYDEEGKLVRVKKETERGIMTINETRENLSK